MSFAMSLVQALLWITSVVLAIGVCYLYHHSLTVLASWCQSGPRWLSALTNRLPGSITLLIGGYLGTYYISLLLGPSRLYSILGQDLYNRIYPGGGISVFVGAPLILPLIALWHTAMKRLVIDVLMILAVLSPVSAFICKYYWGYYISRPALPEALFDLEPPLKYQFIARTPAEPRLRFDSSRRARRYDSSDYYLLDERALVALRDAKHEIREEQPVSEETLSEVLDYLEAEGRLDGAEEGYDGVSRLWGIALTSATRDDALFLAVSGAQISNDHYPYYEFLLRLDDSGKPREIISSNRFFFDVAGLEGFEFLPILLVFTFPVVTLVIWCRLVALILRWNPQIDSKSAIV